jgi:AraC-like DNA-binding protein
MAEHSKRATARRPLQRPGRSRPACAPARSRRFAYPAGKSLPVALTLPMTDYAADEIEDLSELPQLETLTLLGHPCHYRARAREAYASGEVEFCVLADGFFVQMCELAFCAPTFMSVTAPDMLRVRIATEGDGEYVSAHGDSVSIEGPSALVIIEPAGQPPADAAFAGRNRSVHVYVHRDALGKLYAGGERELPAVLQAFLDGDLEHTVARRLPLGPALLRCLEDLCACALEGHSRRLFIRSKAVEILCHAFEVLDQEDGAAPSSMLAARGVMKAQRLLMESFVSPPSLDDLAQEVGMSRSGLCAGFRQIVGHSVYDYIQDLRMQQALALLAERDVSITEIAYAVGYTHPSSFSVAVQRRFGATPRELRRRGTLPTS